MKGLLKSYKQIQNPAPSINVNKTRETPKYIVGYTGINVHGDAFKIVKIKPGIKFGVTNNKYDILFTNTGFLYTDVTYSSLCNVNMKDYNKLTICDIGCPGMKNATQLAPNLCVKWRSHIELVSNGRATIKKEWLNFNNFVKYASSKNPGVKLKELKYFVPRLCKSIDESTVRFTRYK